MTPINLLVNMSDNRQISEMRNLGPAVQSDLAAVGITTAQQVIDLGPEETFIQMLLGRQKIGRSGKCCNAAYLYTLHGAIHDLDWRQLPEQTKNDYKQLTASMRESGRFA